MSVADSLLTPDCPEIAAKYEALPVTTRELFERLGYDMALSDEDLEKAFRISRLELVMENAGINYSPYGDVYSAFALLTPDELESLGYEELALAVGDIQYLAELSDEQWQGLAAQMDTSTLTRLSVLAAQMVLDADNASSPIDPSPWQQYVEEGEEYLVSVEVDKAAEELKGWRPGTEAALLAELDTEIQKMGQFPDDVLGVSTVPVKHRFRNLHTIMVQRQDRMRGLQEKYPGLATSEDLQVLEVIRFIMDEQLKSRHGHFYARYFQNRSGVPSLDELLAFQNLMSSGASLEFFLLDPIYILGAAAIGHAPIWTEFLHNNPKGATLSSNFTHLVDFTRHVLGIGYDFIGVGDLIRLYKQWTECHKVSFDIALALVFPDVLQALGKLGKWDDEARAALGLLDEAYEARRVRPREIAFFLEEHGSQTTKQLISNLRSVIGEGSINTLFHNLTVDDVLALAEGKLTYNILDKAWGARYISNRKAIDLTLKASQSEVTNFINVLTDFFHSNPNVRGKVSQVLGTFIRGGDTRELEIAEELSGHGANVVALPRLQNFDLSKELSNPDALIYTDVGSVIVDFKNILPESDASNVVGRITEGLEQSKNPGNISTELATKINGTHQFGVVISITGQQDIDTIWKTASENLKLREFDLREFDQGLIIIQKGTDLIDARRIVGQELVEVKIKR